MRLWADGAGHSTKLEHLLVGKKLGLLIARAAAGVVRADRLTGSSFSSSSMCNSAFSVAGRKKKPQ